jgi:hypothetical protein
MTEPPDQGKAHAGGDTAADGSEFSSGLLGWQRLSDQFDGALAEQSAVESTLAVHAVERVLR